jgi:hypothetical protein
VSVPAASRRIAAGSMASWEEAMFGKLHAYASNAQT